MLLVWRLLDSRGVIVDFSVCRIVSYHPVTLVNSVSLPGHNIYKSEDILIQTGLAHWESGAVCFDIAVTSA